MHYEMGANQLRNPYSDWFAPLEHRNPHSGDLYRYVPRT
jgi:hypothetical protein